MIVSTPAPVAPRVVFQGRQDSLPLETAVTEFCARHDAGALNIMGDEGLGKTTALAHLAAVLPNAERIVFLDEPPLESVFAAAERSVVVFTSREHGPLLKVRRLHLLAWSCDELIEYLLAKHAPRCRAVMSRLTANARGDRQSPVFWRSVLDAMVADEHLENLEQAINWCLEERFPDPQLRELVGWASLGQALKLTDAEKLQKELEHTLSRDSLLFVRTEPVQQLLIREQAQRGLLSKRCSDVLVARWPLNLVDEVALDLSAMSEATKVLQKSLNGKDARLYATAASLMVRVDPNWQPESRHQLGLDGASLKFVDWKGCNLSGFRLLDVDLSGANLTRANLSGVRLDRGTLFQTVMTGVTMRQGRLMLASLQEADLSGADCSACRLTGTCLHRAIARQAKFDGAKFMGTDCSHADFREVSCRDTVFETVDFSDADLSGADLTGADIRQADLRTTELSGARLIRADLRKINIEEVEWSSVDLSNADLCEAKCTGSVLHEANLSDAVLHHAELGGIHWEQADLRDADLREVTFHLGSSRSGLVFSPHAGEGSRTGFYTDESLEQYFQSPEEIRKANLRGADLRGAKVDGVDFYLVDLRDALLDPEQLQQAQRTGAILSRE